MTTDASESWDETVDVVVVGSGGGITGAYTAAREGLSVALVEATDKFGGTTAFSGGGGMWFPCNPVLRRAGVDDTIDEALRLLPRRRRRPHAARAAGRLRRAAVRALIEYLEQDDAFRVQGAAVARLLRQRARRAPATVCATSCRGPLPGDALGPYAGPVRGPLDNERLGAPAPDLLTGGRALDRPLPRRAARNSPTRPRTSTHPLTDLDRRRRRRRRAPSSQRDGEQVRIRRPPRRAARRGRVRAQRRRCATTSACQGESDGHHGRAGQHRRRAPGGDPGRRRHRPDGSGVVVAGPDASRRPVDVLALVHRRHLRRLRRTALRQRVRPPTTGSAASHRADRLRRNDDCRSGWSTTTATARSRR